MLDRIHGEIYFECDSCGDTLETDTKNFPEACTQLKSNHWRARKLSNTIWVHECPQCQSPKPS